MCFMTRVWKEEKRCKLLIPIYQSKVFLLLLWVPTTQVVTFVYDVWTKPEFSWSPIQQNWKKMTVMILLMLFSLAGACLLPLVKIKWRQKRVSKENMSQTAETPFLRDSHAQSEAQEE
jgi:hypothetical protein